MAHEWSQTLETGDVTIDEQHRMFFEQAQRIARACEGNNVFYETQRTLQFMREYALNHFGIEERRMADVGYPYIETHRTAHRSFLHQLEDFEAAMARSEDKRAVALEIAEFLGRWLSRHIKLVDRPLIEYLAGHRSSF